MGMKVLVIGSGAREHAIAHTLLRGDSVQEVTVAPGNPGMEADGIRTTRLSPANHAALIDFVKDNQYDWVFVGPEVPLIEGIVDDFAAAGIKAFGPDKAAAQIEGSKDFAKQLMERHGIPTAAYQVFTDLESSQRYVREHGAPIVIKADGLAAGKGVTVAMDEDTALRALDDIFVDHRFGQAGAKVVIEDFLDGEEASFIVMVDGKNVLALASSQDHKRIFDGDQGPNTGGMGAYSPAPCVTPEVHAKAMREIILPTVRGMAADGIPFTGFLYAGLMIGKDGSVKTLEFNCRMGDPETQPIMMRLKSDLVDLLGAAVDGKLDQVELQWDRRTALGVVMAAAGYPEAPRKGDAITGLPPEADDAMVFHAGTQLQDGVLRASGGRVLCVTALGDNVRQAQQRAYDVARGVHFDGAQYRRDIGHRAVKN